MTRPVRKTEQNSGGYRVVARTPDISIGRRDPVPELVRDPYPLADATLRKGDRVFLENAARGGRFGVVLRVYVPIGTTVSVPGTAGPHRVIGDRGYTGTVQENGGTGHISEVPYAQMRSSGPFAASPYPQWASVQFDAGISDHPVASLRVAQRYDPGMIRLPPGGGTPVVPVEDPGMIYLPEGGGPPANRGGFIQAFGATGLNRAAELNAAAQRRQIPTDFVPRQRTTAPRKRGGGLVIGLGLGFGLLAFLR